MPLPTAMTLLKRISSTLTYLKECVNLIPKGNVSIMASDMNAETGNNTNGWNDCLGAYGYGILNARMGVRMLSFVSSNSLVCANLQFRHRTCHKLTFSSHDGQTKKQINHFLVHCSYRSIGNDVRVYTCADIPSDHKLVVALIKRHLREGLTFSTEIRHCIQRFCPQQILCTSQF